MKRYPIWSYLSISAMDAPLISIAWYLYFAQNLLNISLNIQHCLILGVSVWLGYMADRLFDIRFKKEAQLISLRHQFCKENEFKLWILWLIILIPITIFSLNTLNNDKIFAGLILILFILLYNCLNQCFSRKRFPKEICVAALFSYGTLFLIENPLKIEEFIHLTLICFLNCLILTHKEKQVDKLMGINSWTNPFTHRSIIIILALFCIYFLIAYQGRFNPFFAICLSCLALHIKSHHIDEERFRIILEFLYAIIPLWALIAKN